MNTIVLRRAGKIGTSLFILCFLGTLTACAGSNSTVLTPFLPPTAIANVTPLVLPQTVAPLAGPTPTPVCTNDLLFIQDMTIPDNTAVAAGSQLDKVWQLQNNGTCNWDGRYRVRFLDGDPLGAPIEQALYPARAGTQFSLRMLFTAPSMPGTYTSEWQAYDPLGVSFGATFFIKIVVNP